jgi:hypothetical protein
LAKTGSLVEIYQGATFIDRGRRGLDTKGKTEKGRISFKRGLNLALKAFNDVQSQAEEDLNLVLVAE